MKPFAAIQAPHALEWLTDNGSVYTAHETRAFATALNLVPCFTPIQSPESNGISESFVKTLKRICSREPSSGCSPHSGRSPDGQDYNENHPHSGLKMHTRELELNHNSPVSGKRGNFENTLRLNLLASRSLSYRYIHAVQRSRNV